LSLFSRLFKPKPELPEREAHQEGIETVGLLLLAAQAKRDDSLRHSARFGELLGMLWEEEKSALDVVHTVFASVERIDRKYLETLSRLLRAAHVSPPPTLEERYQAVLQALAAEIQTIPFQSLPFPEDTVRRTIPSEAAARLVNVLILARILLMHELHQPICAFLVTNGRACLSRPNNEAALPYQLLIREHIHRFLSSLDPETMPHFWAALRDAAHPEEFWPTLRRIRDSKAVPYLLELLPAAQDEEDRSSVSLEGQKEIIQVLREIGDSRAVPTLLAIEKRHLPPSVEKPGILNQWDLTLSAQWQERTELSRIAGQAARHIMRNSPDSGAQLLRPSEMPAKTDDTLLRPAGPESNTTPPEELMRPSVEPE
jgi:hypothetical protein